MTTEGEWSDPSHNQQRRFLAADEPAPFTVLNGDVEKPCLLICDHASRRFPAAAGSLGLDPGTLRCHLAWDIGAGPVTEQLAERLNVTAVVANYSRLVVDLNRDLMDPSAFLEFSDGVVVHGNRGLSDDDKAQRAADIYHPYHRAVDAELRRLNSNGLSPAFISIHSFTPVFNGKTRPWEIGILWDVDRPTAEIFIDGFRQAGFNVGDNEPYSGKAPMDYTIDHHAEAAGIPHVGIEIRQDLIDHDAGVKRLVDVLAEIVPRVRSFAVGNGNQPRISAPA